MIRTIVVGVVRCSGEGERCCDVVPAMPAATTKAGPRAVGPVSSSANNLADRALRVSLTEF